MPQEDLQVNSQEQENPDETAAVLAFATKLSEQTLPKAEEKQVQETEPEKAPEEEVNVEEKLNDFKKEIKEMIKEEISTIKESIQSALEDGEE